MTDAPKPYTIDELLKWSPGALTDRVLATAKALEAAGTEIEVLRAERNSRMQTIREVLALPPDRQIAVLTEAMRIFKSWPGDPE
jgi:hypothetical protein